MQLEIGGYGFAPIRRVPIKVGVGVGVGVHPIKVGVGVGVGARVGVSRSVGGYYGCGL